MNAKLVVLVTRCDNKNPVQIVKKKKILFRSAEGWKTQGLDFGNASKDKF